MISVTASAPFVTQATVKSICLVLVFVFVQLVRCFTPSLKLQVKTLDLPKSFVEQRLFSIL